MIDNPLEDKSEAELVKNANDGLSGQGASVEAMRRLRVSIDELLASTERYSRATERYSRAFVWLNIILIVLTVFISMLTAVLTAHDMHWIPTKPAETHESHAESG